MTASTNPLEPLLTAVADRVAERIEKRLLENPPIRPRLLSVAQAAQYLGRTPGAVKNMLHSGKLRRVPLDERIFFDVVELDRLIEDAKER